MENNAQTSTNNDNLLSLDVWTRAVVKRWIVQEGKIRACEASYAYHTAQFFFDNKINTIDTTKRYNRYPIGLMDILKQYGIKLGTHWILDRQRLSL